MVSFCLPQAQDLPQINLLILLEVIKIETKGMYYPIQPEKRYNIWNKKVWVF
jgi:hypothetical protein